MTLDMRTVQFYNDLYDSPDYKAAVEVARAARKAGVSDDKVLNAIFDWAELDAERVKYVGTST